MSEQQIPGVPEGYRLGEAIYLRDDKANITFELIPDERPKQYEAVIVVPLGKYGRKHLTNAVTSRASCWDTATAMSYARKYPERITIREKGASS